MRKRCRTELHGDLYRIQDVECARITLIPGDTVYSPAKTGNIMARRPRRSSWTSSHVRNYHCGMWKLEKRFRLDIPDATGWNKTQAYLFFDHLSGYCYVTPITPTNLIRNFSPAFFTWLAPRDVANISRATSLSARRSFLVLLPSGRT